MKYVVKFFAAALIATTIHSTRAIYTVDRVYTPDRSFEKKQGDVRSFCSRKCNRMVPYDTYGDHTLESRVIIYDCKNKCVIEMRALLRTLSEQTQKALAEKAADEKVAAELAEKAAAEQKAENAQ